MFKEHDYALVKGSLLFDVYVYQDEYYFIRFCDINDEEVVRFLFGKPQCTNEENLDVEMSREATIHEHSKINNRIKYLLLQLKKNPDLTVLRDELERLKAKSIELNAKAAMKK